MACQYSQKIVQIQSDSCPSQKWKNCLCATHFQPTLEWKWGGDSFLIWVRINSGIFAIDYYCTFASQYIYEIIKFEVTQMTTWPSKVLRALAIKNTWLLTRYNFRPKLWKGQLKHERKVHQMYSTRRNSWTLVQKKSLISRTKEGLHQIWSHSNDNMALKSSSSFSHKKDVVIDTG